MRGGHSGLLARPLAPAQHGGPGSAALSSVNPEGESWIHHWLEAGLCRAWPSPGPGALVQRGVGGHRPVPLSRGSRDLVPALRGAPKDRRSPGPGAVRLAALPPPHSPRTARVGWPLDGGQVTSQTTQTTTEPTLQRDEPQALPVSLRPSSSASCHSPVTPRLSTA